MPQTRKRSIPPNRWRLATSNTDSELFLCDFHVIDCYTNLNSKKWQQLTDHELRMYRDFAGHDLQCHVCQIENEIKNGSTT